MSHPKIMLSGLPAEVSEAEIRQALAPVGPVLEVQIVRDGDPEKPVVLVTLAISDEQAFRLTSRVTDYWHDGRMLNARLLPF